MKTKQMSPEAMEARLARFYPIADLTSYTVADVRVGGWVGVPQSMEPPQEE